MSIKRLSEDVVNRIAAGEVIHRPVSAIKEMIENSIDAGATTINVRANQGGMKSFTVQDNGCGIKNEDMEIVCERFTTSKLVSFEDLTGIGTYGFRGEALASISHVAKVTITTKTKDQPCAFKASYANGKLVAPNPGQSAAPKPCAGVTGTTILVEDLFYNMAARKRAIKNIGEEYSRILDTLCKYAVHKGLRETEKKENENLGTKKHLGVGFVCRKQNVTSPDLHTNATDSRLDNIRSIYGSIVANELVYICEESETFRIEEDEGEGDGTCKTKIAVAIEEDRVSENGLSLGFEDSDDDTCKVRRGTVNDELKTKTEGDESSISILPGSKWLVEGYVTNANYHKKKSIYIIFINDRLVSCPALKRSVDALFAEFLPKGSGPFVYLSVHMPPHHVDVNVHPTKREVHFLFEDYIVSQIAQMIRTRLAGANTSRVFYTQQTISNVCELLSTQTSIQNGEETPVKKRVRGEETTLGSESQMHDEGGDGETQQLSTPVLASQRSVAKKPKYMPHKLVRTDPKSSKLDAFFEKAREPPPSTQDSSLSLSSDGEDRDTAINEEKSGLSKKYLEPTTSMFDDSVSEEAQMLTSVHNLIERFEQRKSDKMKEMLADLVFVGWVDECFCLVQVHTGLFIVDYVELCKELFYQQALRKFGTFNRIVFSEPVNIAEVLEIGLEFRSAKKKGSTPPSPQKNKEIAKKYADFLMQRAPMLDEYFRISVDAETGMLRSLPEIVEEYTPQFVALAPFLLRLCEQVEWYDEEGCFDTLAIELANFYSHFPKFSMAPKESLEQTVEGQTDLGSQQSTADCSQLSEFGEQTKFSRQESWMYDKSDIRNVVKNILFPQLRKNLVPYTEHANPDSGVFKQIAALEVLYRIFERC